MEDVRQEDLSRRVSIAQSMLDRVIHTTDNLDEKVGRIFSSMSFLTVGATILYTAYLSDKLSYKVGVVDLVSLFFVLFVIAVAVSTAFMVQAMGPRFHVNPWRRKSVAGQSVKPSPTGYADKIALVNEGEWVNFFQSTTISDLYEKWYSESMKEVFILSKKVDRKVWEMRRAQWFFLLSILFLVVMVMLAASAFL